MRFTIKLKLGLAFGLMICLLAVTAGYGIYSLSNLNSAISALIAGPALRLETAENLSATQLRLARAQMNLATSETAEDIDKYIQASDRNRNLFSEALKKLQDISATDEARKAWGTSRRKPSGSSASTTPSGRPYATGIPIRPSSWRRAMVARLSMTSKKRSSRAWRPIRT